MMGNRNTNFVWLRFSEIRLLTRYVTVGSMSALLEFGIFAGLTVLAGFPVMLSNVIAVSTVTALGFMGQKHFTFRNRGCIRPQAILYLCQVAVNFILNNALVYFLTAVMRIHPFVAKPIQLALCFLFNFSFSRFVVFRERA